MRGATGSREHGEHFLAIRDDGDGIPRDATGLPDFKYVATHICDSIKRKLKAEGDGKELQGEFGIGLLSFWTVGRRLQITSTSADHAYRAMALAHVEKEEQTLAGGRRNVSGRVTLLLADDDVETACSLAEAQTVGLGVLEQLARAVSRTCPALAAGFLKRVVDATLPRLDGRHYAGAVAQIREVAALNPGSETDAWIAGLKQRYRARRKLMALLEEPAPASHGKRGVGALRRARGE